MELHYEYSGQGHPLVILHGLFGSLENWRTLSKAFAQSFQVFALDQRNHGRSPHSEVFDYQAMLEDVHEFIYQHELPTIHLLGHSMGGKVAMQFALTYPDLVDKLVIVDIAPKVYPPGHDDVFAGLFACDPATIRSRQEADAALTPHLPDLTLRQFLLKNLERNEGGSFQWRINLDGIHRNYHEMLKTFAANGTFAKPTLFIRGENSGYIRDHDLVTIREIFPAAQLTTIANTGHWVHSEAPQEFARIVIDFLSH
ncbi:MAG: alpha/beta fold hydrolase [Deltaproteobacteria bacterium]|nr:alpha/beta fold hydrolase [Deltaproteobacteria bacterium]